MGPGLDAGDAVPTERKTYHTSSPGGRFVVTVLGALAQLEREQAAERTKTAMAELRRQGRRISGKPPFGYRFDGDRVVEEPGEQEILRRIRELRDAGKGCYAIASALTREGVVNPRTERPWYFGTVRAILQSAERRLRSQPFVT